MSNKELAEYIKRTSPSDLRILKENISEDFYISHIDNIYDIHFLIKKYCQNNGILIYDKPKSAYELYNYIQRNTNYLNQQLEMQICEKIEEEEREMLEDDEDIY